MLSGRGYGVAAVTPSLSAVCVCVCVCVCLSVLLWSALVPIPQPHFLSHSCQSVLSFWLTWVTITVSVSVSSTSVSVSVCVCAACVCVCVCVYVCRCVCDVCHCVRACARACVCQCKLFSFPSCYYLPSETAMTDQKWCAIAGRQPDSNTRTPRPRRHSQSVQ